MTINDDVHHCQLGSWNTLYRCFLKFYSLLFCGHFVTKVLDNNDDMTKQFVRIVPICSSSSHL